MKNHYVYKINVLSGKYTGSWYIGKRSCYCPIELDPYMGSGTLISKITPKEKCSKEILSVWESSDKAYDEEARLVTYQTLKDPNCLNLKTGGGRDPKDKSIKENTKIYLPDWSTMFFDKFGTLSLSHEIIATKISLGRTDGLDKIASRELKAIKKFMAIQDKYPDEAILVSTRPLKQNEVEDFKEEKSAVKKRPKKKIEEKFPLAPNKPKPRKTMPLNYAKKWWWDGTTYIKNTEL